MNSPSEERRFNKRMKDLLPEDRRIKHDATCIAHKAIINGESADSIQLRTEDGESAEELMAEVRDKIDQLTTHDKNHPEHSFETHTLFKHLPEGKVTALIGRMPKWDITVQEDQPQLTSEMANVIFDLYDFLNNLPEEAHRLFSPLYLDKYSLDHATMTSIYAGLLTKKLNSPELTPEEAMVAAFMHDIGKTHELIADLIKSDKQLSEAEFELINTHPLLGMGIINELFKHGFLYVTDYEKYKSLSQFRKGMRGTIINGALHHHVRPDGKGYPSFVNPDDISLEGKITAIADSFETMTSRRKNIKRRKNSVEYACEELKRCSGLPWNRAVTDKQEPEMQFDPDLVKLFLELNVQPVYF